MLLFLLICVIAVGFWFFRVIPRAREWIDQCDDATNAPYALWAPRPDMEPLDIPLPRLDGVDWAALSKEVDREGIHVVDYDAIGQRGVSGKRRNPANIAVFAIKAAKRYLETRDDRDLLLAARQFRYFADAARVVAIEGRPVVLWCADFDMGHHFNVKAPWRSAYFQIFSMNALLWAYALTRDPRYRELALRGLPALGHTVEEGGLCHRTRNGGLFFEEVVSSPLHHILNGHLHTLVNLNDFRAFTGSDDATPIFEAGVRATIDMLPYYDRYSYSLYSLAPNPGLRNHFNIANPYYHRAHVAILRKLYQLTGEGMFSQYAERWEDHCGSAFDTVWASSLIMFRDTMRFAKRFEM
jgi:hypothetical protein